jgi:dihydroxyacetone kinase-like predicted kinase
VHIETGDYIGFMGKEMLVSCKELDKAAEELLVKMGVDTGEVYMVTAFTGTDAPADVIETLEAYMAENYPDVEFYTVEGGQEVYPFIFVAE